LPETTTPRLPATTLGPCGVVCVSAVWAQAIDRRSRETADIEVVEFAFRIFATKTVLIKAACPTIAIVLLHSLLAGSVAAGLAPIPISQMSDGSSILEPASGALLGIFYGAGSVDETSKLGKTLLSILSTTRGTRTGTAVSPWQPLQPDASL